MRADLDANLNDIQIDIPACLGSVVDGSLKEVGRIHRRKIVKRACTTAGSFLAIVGAFLIFGFTNPALASEIPLVGNLFKQASQKGGHIPQNLEEYGLLQSVEEVSEARTGLTATQAYSDGYTVQAGLAFVPSETENSWDYLDTEYGRTSSATVNGEKAEIISVSTFQKQGGAWVSAMNLKVPENQQNAEKLAVSVTLRDFTGRSGQAGISDAIEGEFSVSFPVTVDKAHEIAFTSKAEDNGAKVLAVKSTPAQTVISIEKPYWGDVHPNVPEDGSKGYPALYTMEGAEIKMDHRASYEEGGYQYNSKEIQTADLYFDGVPAGTKQVILRFCNDNQYRERKKLAEFTIDLEKQAVVSAGTVVEEWDTPYQSNSFIGIGGGTEQNGYCVEAVAVSYYYGDCTGIVEFSTQSGRARNTGKSERLRVEISDSKGNVLFASDSVMAHGEWNSDWSEGFPEDFDGYAADTDPVKYGVNIPMESEPADSGWILEGDTVTVTIKNMDTGEVLCTDTRALNMTQ